MPSRDPDGYGFNTEVWDLEPDEDVKTSLGQRGANLRIGSSLDLKNQSIQLSRSSQQTGSRGRAKSSVGSHFWYGERDKYSRMR